MKGSLFWAVLGFEEEECFIIIIISGSSSFYYIWASQSVEHDHLIKLSISFQQ